MMMFVDTIQYVEFTFGDANTLGDCDRIYRHQLGSWAAITGDDYFALLPLLNRLHQKGQ